MIVSTNRGEPLTLNGSGSPAAKAYGNIAQRLQGEDIPLMDPARRRASRIPRQGAPFDPNQDLLTVMNLRDLIDKIVRRQPASATTARERLQLVLAHDRSDLSPEQLDQMRREIFEVVAKYVDIDLEEGDVSLETEDRVTALVANLPIRRSLATSTPD